MCDDDDVYCCRFDDDDDDVYYYICWRLKLDDDDVYYYNCQRLKLEGETENMCVWTKKRGIMNAVVLMATLCPKSLHGKGEEWIARNILQGLDSRQPMTAMTEKKSPG